MKLKAFCAVGVAFIAVVFAGCPAADGGQKSVGTEQVRFIAANPDAEENFTTLVWSDEFEGNAVKEENWTFERGNGTWGWGNKELQYYQTSFAQVGDGYLRIWADVSGSKAYSARLISKKKKDFKYGRLVGRLRMKCGRGSWPAFWLLGTGSNYSWPACGEIDIMEHVNTGTKIMSTIHFGPSNSAHQQVGGSKEYSTKFPIANLEDWHDYELIWTPKYLEMRVDGYIVTSMLINDKAAFQQPFFVILNYAMGGNLTGVSNINVFDNLPWYMDVDYIRLYQ